MGCSASSVCQITLTIHARQKGGYSALHSAAQHGDEALVTALLDAGASPRVADDNGKDAAQYAEENGHPQLAARLRLQHGGRPG